MFSTRFMEFKEGFEKGALAIVICMLISLKGKHSFLKNADFLEAWIELSSYTFCKVEFTKKYSISW